MGQPIDPDLTPETVDCRWCGAQTSRNDKGELICAICDELVGLCEELADKNFKGIL